MWMNTYEIDDAARRWADHPVLGPATRTLANVRDAADRNSDGWCYWPKPANAAARLMELIEGDRSWDARYGDRPEVTAEQLKAAYRPLRAFRTRCGIGFEIVEPEATTHDPGCKALGGSRTEDGRWECYPCGHLFASYEAWGAETGNEAHVAAVNAAIERDIIAMAKDPAA